MKFLLLLTIALSAKIYSQNNLIFDKPLIDCENKWVAFQKNQDNAYPFGFIYVDVEAGLTFNYEGTFTISSTGEFIPTKLNTSFMKVRLQPNNVMVAFIPENKIKELKVDSTPEWLKNYKTSENSINYLYILGFLYNAWNKCDKALNYLEKANKIDPKYNGLAVELAFSYNCLKQFDKAENILITEIKEKPNDAYVNKEYIYTLIKNNNIKKAIQQYASAKENLQDKQYDAENCYNILQYYYFMKDKENFNKWYKEISTLTNNNKQIKQYSEMMNSEINN